MKTCYSYVILALVSVLAVVTVSACGASTPAPSAPTAQPAPTLPSVKETVTVKETVIVKETVVVMPTAAPTSTATVTLTPTPTITRRAVAPAPAKTVAPGGMLDFTADDIEYKAVQRKEDKKIQLTIMLHPKGGVPPFSFVIDPGAPVEKPVNGLTYTFDWHNCGETEPHTIVLISSDGQKVGPVGFMYPYPCE
jgi:hypothetical protein